MGLQSFSTMDSLHMDSNILSTRRKTTVRGGGGKQVSGHAGSTWKECAGQERRVGVPCLLANSAESVLALASSSWTSAKTMSSANSTAMCTSGRLSWSAAASRSQTLRSWADPHRASKSTAVTSQTGRCRRPLGLAMVAARSQPRKQGEERSEGLPDAATYRYQGLTAGGKTAEHEVRGGAGRRSLRTGYEKPRFTIRKSQRPGSPRASPTRAVGWAKTTSRQGGESRLYGRLSTAAAHGDEQPRGFATTSTVVPCA